MLVQLGAAVNISSRSWNHATSLHFCSQLGKLENLKLLLKYGANVFIKDKCGQTARDRAQKHPECEKILQEQEGLLLLFVCLFVCFYSTLLQWQRKMTGLICFVYVIPYNFTTLFCLYSGVILSQVIIFAPILHFRTPSQLATAVLLDSPRSPWI